MKEVCYVCGRSATSAEHVPPLCIFPESKDVPSAESYRRNLITVPSCDEHNLKKSKDDEYLMMILVAHFTNNEVANQQLRTKVVRAWQRRPHLALAAVKDPQLVRLNGEDTMAFRVDLPRLTRAMELIARGLIFHEKGIRWAGTFRVWGTNMLPSNAERAEQILSTSSSIKAAMATIFSNKPFLGANPDVFKYQLHVPEPPETLGCARLMFYGGLEIVVFGGPEQA